MATKTFYFKNAAPSGSSTSLSLQDGGTAPATGITTTGWTVAKLAATNMSLMIAGSKRASNTFAAGDALTSFSANGCFRSESPLTGVFANTNWTFTFRMRAVSAASSQTGQMRVRLYRSASADGSTGIAGIMGSSVAGTTTAALTTTASGVSTVTWTPGATVTLTNEYLWVMCEWSIIGTSGSNNADAVFYIESAGAIVTPNFVPFVAYTDTITPSSVPIAGATITPLHETHAYTDTITPGSVPITGSSITPVYGGSLTETTIYSVASTSDSAGWGGYAMRSVVPVTSMADATHLVVVTDLGSPSDLRLTTGQGTISGPGSGALVAYTGPPVSQYNHAHEGSAKIDGYSAFVNEIQIRGSGATREVRVRLEAPSASSVIITTASVGIWNGTNDPNSPYLGSTTFTPVQLKWSGVANITLSNGAVAYSDWVVLPDNIKAVYGAYTMSSINAGWQNYTFVTTHLAANLRAGTGSEVRVGLYFHPTTAAGQTAVCYINQAAASGDAYDFKAGTPARLMFGGSDTLTFDGVTGYVLSDWVPLPDDWDNTKNYAVSAQFPPGGTVDIHYGAAPALGGSLYYKNGVAEAALVDKTGYAPFFANVPSFVEIIEVRSAAPAAGINYTDTITASALPIVGATITPVYVAGPINYTDTITTSTLPIVGATINPVYAGAATSIANAWNVNDKTAGVTLSNADKTATLTAGDGVRSTTLHDVADDEKYYGEFLCVQASGVMAGVSRGPPPALIANDYGFAISLYQNGTIYAFGGATGLGTAAIVDGDTVCVATDTLNNKVWLRLNNGYWNGVSTDDPATNSGGITSSGYSIQALQANSFIGPTEVTIRTELAALVFPVPSGFKSWMGEGATTGINYTDTITAAAVPVAGAAVADVYARSDTIAPSSVPIVGAAAADVYARSDTLTPSAVPITGQTVTPAFSKKYTDTIAPSAVPIVGSTVTPVFSKKYTDTLTAGALPIGGLTITPIFSAGGINYTEIISPAAVPLVGLALTDVFARKEILTAGVVPIAGQPITPVFAVGVPVGKTWVKTGGVWKETTTYVKVGGTWTLPIASFVKDGGVWKRI